MVYFKPHDLMFHLETHTNCGHEGTIFGMKNCAAPVMPQNMLDRAMKTLYLNADIKAANTSIKVCQRSNSKKLWSESPTSNLVTDPCCESMLQTEWSRSPLDWTPHQVGPCRWLLLVHHTINNTYAPNIIVCLSDMHHYACLKIARRIQKIALRMRFARRMSYETFV